MFYKKCDEKTTKKIFQMTNNCNRIFRNKKFWSEITNYTKLRKQPSAGTNFSDKPIMYRRYSQQSVIVGVLTTETETSFVKKQEYKL